MEVEALLHRKKIRPAIKKKTTKGKERRGKRQREQVQEQTAQNKKQ